jgi:hypothetical protein
LEPRFHFNDLGFEDFRRRFFYFLERFPGNVLTEMLYPMGPANQETTVAAQRVLVRSPSVFSVNVRQVRYPDRTLFVADDVGEEYPCNF